MSGTSHFTYFYIKYISIYSIINIFIRVYIFIGV